MRNFQNKNKWKYILQSKPVLAILFCLVLIFGWSVYGFWGKMSETAKNRQIIEDKITQLRQEKEKLSSDISKLNTDRGVEESIRDKFGLARDGEGLIVIVDEEGLKGEELEANSGGFFSFFKNLFK